MPIVQDSFTNPTPTDYLTDPDHAGQHDNVNDAVEALEAVLVGADAPTSAGQFLKSTGPGTSGFSTASTTDLDDVDPADTPDVGDLRQWDGTYWVSVTVPLVTNLIWEGDDPTDSEFLDPF